MFKVRFISSNDISKTLALQLLVLIGLFVNYNGLEQILSKFIYERINLKLTWTI